MKVAYESLARPVTGEAGRRSVYAYPCRPLNFYGAAMSAACAIARASGG